MRPLQALPAGGLDVLRVLELDLAVPEPLAAGDRDLEVGLEVLRGFEQVSGRYRAAGVDVAGVLFQELGERLLAHPPLIAGGPVLPRLGELESQDQAVLLPAGAILAAAAHLSAVGIQDSGYSARVEVGEHLGPVVVMLGVVPLEAGHVPDGDGSGLALGEVAVLIAGQVDLLHAARSQQRVVVAELELVRPRRSGGQVADNLGRRVVFDHRVTPGMSL